MTNLIIGETWIQMIKWSEKTREKKGLPRPVGLVFGKNNPYVPIPFQSSPRDTFKGLLLDNFHEAKVLQENLCSYCGLSTEVMGDYSQWTTADNYKTVHKDIVESDTRLLHKECMRQARIFCPFMAKLLDDEIDEKTVG